MEKHAYKGYIEYMLKQRNLQLWRAIFDTFAQDSKYASMNWDGLNNRIIRLIQDGTLTEKAARCTAL